MSLHVLRTVSEIWMSSITEKIQKKIIKLAEFFFNQPAIQIWGYSLTVHVTGRRNNGGFPFVLDVAGYSAVMRSALPFL